MQKGYYDKTARYIIIFQDKYGNEIISSEAMWSTQLPVFQPKMSTNFLRPLLVTIRNDCKKLPGYVFKANFCLTVRFTPGQSLMFLD